ncbi:MAG: replication-associated recombination protein A [candidate division WS1 bacterium]|jgi:putative ATPase|nr:replication-associated recombination protein A [candidate division WS1 bacterium]
MDLFDDAASPVRPPLAARMRPTSLDEVVGQQSLIGPGGVLRQAIQDGWVSSLILHGPAGSGKSTLARIIARASGMSFVEFSATSSGVKEIREAADHARNERKLYGRGTVVFCDEIHRLNKGQQDAFLPFVEDGVFALIGATTENPYFEINAPLLSRCLVARLEPLSDEDLLQLIKRALTDEERGLGDRPIDLRPEARAILVRAANGDARRALGALEQAAFLAPYDSEGTAIIDVEVATQATQQRLVLYDKSGQAHYNVISSYIKSIRGSDPDAAVFWLGYMLEAGEDPRFIARRMVIAAAEDIGNADPMGLVLAVAAAHAVELCGMPEAQIPLAQATVYLACTEKSNRAYLAVADARAAAREGGPLKVPPHLMDIRHEAQRREGLGVGYKYPHDFDGAFCAQQYLPDTLVDRRFYRPSDRGREKALRERIQRIWGERYRD